MTFYTEIYEINKQIQVKRKGYQTFMLITQTVIPIGNQTFTLLNE